MRTIALAGAKGGVGKTSVAIHLAEGLRRQGRRVLLIDLDPTGHLSTWLLGLDRSPGKGTAEALLDDAIGPAYYRDVEGRPGLSLMPATPALQGADLTLAQTNGGQAILRGLLGEVARSFDFAVLDCPPSLGIYTFSALCAASAVLAPVPCTPLALVGLRLLEENVALARKRLGASAAIIGFLPFAADPRESLTAETRTMLEDAAKALVYRSEVRVSAAAKALPLHRATAWDDGRDPRGREDYQAVLRETMSRWEKR